MHVVSASWQRHLKKHLCRCPVESKDFAPFSSLGSKRARVQLLVHTCLIQAQPAESKSYSAASMVVYLKTNSFELKQLKASEQKSQLSIVPADK